MKSLSIILSTLLLGAAVYAADFSSKSTDELLGMRGTMTTEQERSELHNELMMREKTMTKDQLEKFKTYPPENRVKKFKNQGQGQGMGQGKGMGQGQGMGGGMGGGKNR
ncbi:MAG: hypothetical protein MUP09_12490 [Thiovulaceae bacterium]|nr:hypothetical protein [Sulfurimonadaceae bacterium]